MSMTDKGRKATHARIPAMRALGSTIGTDLPTLALAAYWDRPATKNPRTSKAADPSVEDVLDQATGLSPEAARSIVAAHWWTVSQYEDDAFLAGWFAGLAAAKAGAR